MFWFCFVLLLYNCTILDALYSVKCGTVINCNERCLGRANFAEVTQFVFDGRSHLFLLRFNLFHVISQTLKHKK